MARARCAGPESVFVKLEIILFYFLFSMHDFKACEGSELSDFLHSPKQIQIIPRYLSWQIISSYPHLYEASREFRTGA